MDILEKTKQSLKEVYKFSTYESINEFKKGLIDENTFRNSKDKKQRDMTPNSIKQAQYKERHKNLQSLIAKKIKRESLQGKFKKNK